MRIVNILFNQKGPELQRIAGVEQSFIDYATIFSGEGHEVLSIARPDSPYKALLTKERSKVCEVKLSTNVDIFSIVKMTIAILRFRPDAIICHSGRAFIFARIAKFFLQVPIIAINHGTNAIKFLKADYVFNVNSFICKEIIDLGKDPKTCFVMPNMLQIPKDFTPPTKKIRHNPLIIGGLGRLSGEKAYNVSIRAVAILKSRGIIVNLHVGGSGALESYLRNLAKELGVEDQIKFLGWVKNKRTFFEDIDIFVLPSRYETFGIVILEAMLYKTPMIVADSWGPKDIIRDGVDGLLFSRDNEDEMPEPLANQIEKLYNDEELSRKMAESAYQRFWEKYSFDVVKKQIENLLTDILSPKTK